MNSGRGMLPAMQMHPIVVLKVTKTDNHVTIHECIAIKQMRSMTHTRKHNEMLIAFAVGRACATLR